MKKNTTKVQQYYSSISRVYGQMYDQKSLLTSEEYMADWFRYNLIIKRLKKLKIKGSIIDIGCGEGTPLINICKKTKLNPWALDYTKEMVIEAKNNFIDNGINSSKVVQSNISNSTSFKKIFNGKKFNASLCLGVMPHVPNVLTALKNIRYKMVKNGVAYVSFRNLLFSLFTLNRYSKDFFIDIFMNSLSNEDKRKVSKDLQNRFAVELPPIRTKGKTGGIGYDTITANFHNPLTIEEIFKKAGFSHIKIYFYHFHPTPPMYEKKLISKNKFRKLAIELEGNPSDWRGNFMCSAFLVEAIN